MKTTQQTIGNREERTVSSMTEECAVVRDCRCASRDSRRGYSLVELLFAVFILGAGLAMSAVLFPAAIRQNKTSFNDSIGTMICKNAIAAAASRITPSDFTAGASTYTILADENDKTGQRHDTFLSIQGQHWPTWRQDSDVADGGQIRGYILLGRPAGRLPTDGYCLVAVAYAREKYRSLTDKKFRMVLRRTTIQYRKATGTDTYISATKPEAAYFTIGSPIIFDPPDPSATNFATMGGWSLGKFVNVNSVYRDPAGLIKCTTDQFPPYSYANVNQAGPAYVVLCAYGDDVDSLTDCDANGLWTYRKLTDPCPSISTMSMRIFPPRQ